MDARYIRLAGRLTLAVSLAGVVTAGAQVVTVDTFTVSSARFSDLLQDIDVAAGPDGSFTVVWGAYAYPGGFSGNRDHAGARRFSAAGVPLGDAVQVDTSAHVRNPTIAAVPGGGYAVAWEQSGNRYETAAQLLSSNALPTGPDLLLTVDATGGGSRATAVGMNAGPVLVWNERGLWARSLDPNRNRRGGDILLGTSEYAYTVDAATLADGGYVVAWKNLWEDVSRARVFGPTGQPRGSELIVTAAFRAGRVAADPGGGFAILGEAFNQTLARTEVWARKFAADGTPAGPEFLVHTPATTNVYLYEDLDFDENGNLFVVWTEHNAATGDRIPPTGRGFDRDGNPLGPAVLLSTRAGAGVRVVRLANGQFATVWYDHGLAVGLIAALCPPATAVCGDGVRAAACEQCDDGAANSDTAADACRTSCRLPSCGDGAVDSAEECDDGNAGACDGCSPTCTVEPGYACGDGVRSAACGEECDAGAANSDSLPDACRGDCTLSRCGDGVTDAGEACDDGNQQSCDGCTFDCRREAELADANGNGIADICDACRDFLAPVAGTAAECIPLVNSAVSQAQRARFATGAEEFLEVETPASGLGPVFNGASCAECHNRPVIGGSSARMVTRIGAQNAGGQFDALETHGGPLLQDQGIETPTCSEAGEVVPPEATIVAQRNAPALFGLGLLEAIPRQQIDRLVDTSDRNGDGISGRPGFGGAGRLGRFGWKAQVASAHDFAVGAYLDEMGITSPYAMSENNPQGQAPLCDAEADPEDDGNAILAFTEFMQLLAEPPATAWSREARRGRSVFKKVKCHKCHVDRYRTRDVPIAALRNRRVRAYTDLLLHNMGPVLADGIRQGNAEGYEFRTPPLWGVRHSAPYLHDGRAATIEDAIVAHGGEAQAARDNFLALPLVKRQQLIAFLNAL